ESASCISRRKASREPSLRCILPRTVTQIVPHFDFRIAFGVSVDQGHRRDTLEDAHLVCPDLSLFAVADGMGGHEGGEVAAALALEELETAIRGVRAQRLIQAYVSKPGLDARRRVFACLKQAF